MRVVFGFNRRCHAVDGGPNSDLRWTSAAAPDLLEACQLAEDALCKTLNLENGTGNQDHDEVQYILWKTTQHQRSVPWWKVVGGVLRRRLLSR